MAEKSMFFNSEGDDRRIYSATDFAAYFAELHTTGIYRKAQDGSDLRVTVQSGMKLQVAPGSANINGYRYVLEDGPLELEVPLAVGASRTNRVVLRLSLAPGERSMKIYIKQGSNTPPDLERNGTTYELSLARVTARLGSSLLNSGDVTDERGDLNLCGWVRSTADPAYYPSGSLPELLWKYTIFPDTLTPQERAEVERDVNLMQTYRAANFVKLSDKATTDDACTGKDDTKWMTPAKTAAVISGYAYTDSQIKAPITGVYNGDDSPSRVIPLGFTPQAVLVLSGGVGLLANGIYRCGGLAISGYPLGSGNTTCMEIVNNGFRVFQNRNTNASMNDQFSVYVYIAFR